MTQHISPRSIADSGAWISPGRLVRRNVDSALDVARAAVSEFERARAELMTAGHEPEEADHLAASLNSAAEVATLQAILSACVYIEGTVNFYGTARLGEAFFRAHVERLSTRSKLLVTLAICEQKLFDDSALVDAAKLFDRRNQLVHPKTKEIADPQRVKRILDAYPTLAADIELAERGVNDFITFGRVADPRFELYVPSGRSPS